MREQLTIRKLMNLTALEVGRDTATPSAALCREMGVSAAAMLEPGEDHMALAGGKRAAK